MSALKQVMHTIDSHHISNSLIVGKCDKLGGLLTFDDYVWYAYGSNIVLYSKRFKSVMSHRSFGDSVKITCVKEITNCGGTYNFILVGCSFKTTGKLFVCQLPTLTILRCIHLPNIISSIASILNNSQEESQLCDEFKIMSTVLLVGMVSGAVFAIDLRQNFIENQLESNEFIENESKLNQLFIIRRNEDCQEVKEMSDDSDSHLAMFINENFHAYCKKQYNNKLMLNVSSLLYIKEINTIAIGYSTGHFQLWDCEIMRTLYLLKEPKCVMPITHLSFLEPSDDPNNLCYIWVIQSDNSKIPNATMIALTYEERTVMPNGFLLYKNYQGSGVKLEMSLKREPGFGRCVSALSLCNLNLFRNKTDMDEDCEIKLFAMLLEICRDADCKPESYIFLFDINQWYKAQMPSIISHLKVSNSYASFVKLPNDVSYLDFNISDRTLRPFGYNFRNNVEELYYPSSIYFECDCLMDTEIVKFKHAGVQQEILDQLLSKNWKLLTNPACIFSQCIETNLRPFFWDKLDDYANYSLPDKRSFVVSIIVENQIMSVLSACAEEWKNGTYVSSEATILHLVKCLWKHVMVVKQYADKLCVPLFDYSGTQLDKKNVRILNHCLCQMQCIKNFLQFLHNEYGIHVINVDYSHRIYSLNLVTDYFKAVRCFLRYSLLPESLEDNINQSKVHSNFKYLTMYADKRRVELRGLQIYLIDAIVFNEPKGNKLIEQWLHEGGEETKGLYPPSNIQCLLRIYLNASLTDLVKNFIIIYFLIDVCASQDMNVALANRMCNFALEVDIPDYKELNLICRGSWLLDHDMFEDAMGTFTSDRKWIEVINKYGDWFHWTVLKLLEFKSEYSWARFYLNLVNMNIDNIENHKFYINIQIMNNHSFDVLMYIRARSLNDKDILFEYFFERCRETHKLKCLLDCPWEPEEGQLLDSFLKKFNDSETLNFQLLFLLKRQKYIEAFKLYKSIERRPEYKNDDMLAITGVLVNQFYKTIPEIFKQDFNHHPIFKLPYKKSEVLIKTINNETNKFCFADKKKENILCVKNPSITSYPLLILPPRSIKQKHSPLNDLINNEKRRKTDDILLSPPRSIKEDLSFAEKNVLEILNTPLVEKTIASPSIATCSSILKTGSAKKPNRLLSLKRNDTSRTVLRFSLPGENRTTIEKIGSREEQEITNEITNTIDREPIEISLKHLPDGGSEIELFENSNDQKQNLTYEKMEISEEFKIDQIHQENLYDMDSNVSNENVNLLISDDEIEENVANVLLGDHSSTSNKENLNSELGSQDREMETVIPTNVENSFTHAISPIITHTFSLSAITDYSSTNLHEPKPFSDSENINVISSSSDTNSEDSVKTSQSSSDDEDGIVVDSETEDEINIIHSDCSSNESSSENNDLSSETDLDETKYGRFKSQKSHSYEDTVETSNVNKEEHRSKQTNESCKGKSCDSESCDVLSSGEEGDPEPSDIMSSPLSSEEKEFDDECSEEENSEICDQSFNEDEDDNLKPELDETKYGRFKSQKSHSYEDTVETSHVNEEEYRSKQTNESCKGNSSDSDSCDVLSSGEEGDPEPFDIMSSPLSSEEKEFDEESYDEECSEEDNSEICDQSFNEDEDDNLKPDVQYAVKTHSETTVDIDEENESIKSEPLHYDDSCEDVDDNFEENEVVDNMLDKAEKKVIDDDIEVENSSAYNLTHSSLEPAGENNSQHYDDEINNVEENVHDSVVDVKNANINVDVLEHTSVVDKENANINVDVIEHTSVVEKENANINVDVLEHTSVVDKENANINVEVLEHTSYVAENMSNTSNIENSFMDIECNKDDNDTNQFVDHSSQDISPSTNNNYNNIPMNEPNLNPENCFNNEMVSEIDSNVPETNNFSYPSTPFLFGEQLFGTQEILDNKPMVLFGQVYSSENEEAVANTNASKNDTQDLMTDTGEEISPKNESEEVEPVDEIQDIIELRSLPESNPDDNLGVHNSLKNTLLSKFNESGETLTYPVSETPIIGFQQRHINIVRASSEPKQCNMVVMDSSERAKSVPPKLKDSLDVTLFKIHSVQLVQKSINSPTKQTSSVSNPNLLNISGSNVKISSVEEVSLNCSEQQSNSKNEVKSGRSLRAKSAQLLKSPCVTLDLTSVENTTVHSKSMFTSNLNKLDGGYSDNKSKNVNEYPLNSSKQESIIDSERKLRCSKQSKSEQLTEKTTIDIKNSRTDTQKVKNKKSQSVIEKIETLGDSERVLRRSTRSKSLVNTAVGIEKCNLPIDKIMSTQNIDKEKEQHFVNDIPADILEHSDHKILQCDKKINRSSRKSIKTSNNDIILQKTPDIKKTPIKIKEKKRTSKSFINEQVDHDITKQGMKSSKAKSIAMSDDETKVTRLRSKSESNIIHTNSLDFFHPSEMVDKSRQKRVILPKKKLNDKQNDELKVRKERSKSLAPIKEMLGTKTAFGLEQIIEEDTSNPDQQVEVHSTVPAKPKFNFRKNISKKDESKIQKFQQFSREKTPRRAKSVQSVPPPAATLSLVKPKRRSSINYDKIRPDNKSVTESNDLLEFLKKPLVTAKKPKKRSSSEPLERETKKKITKKEEVKSVLKYDSHQSNESSNYSSASNEQFSPIAGNNSPHLLYTPAAKKLKHTPTKAKTALNFETDDSSDESYSERKTRSKTSHSISKSTPNRPTNLVSEIQSTSTTSDTIKHGSKVSKEKLYSPKKTAIHTTENSNKPSKNLKKSTDKPMIVEEVVSERRVTRLLQSKLNSSQQFTSVTEHDETPKTQEKKKTKKK